MERRGAQPSGIREKRGCREMERQNYRQTRRELLSQRRGKILIASHRGKFGASVVENTVTAFLLALGQGADMVEMDLDRTADGYIVCHHDPDMRRLFHREGKIGEQTLAALQKLTLYNVYGEPCREKLSLFSEVLQALRGRTMLVLDRCWSFWDEVDSLVKGAAMEEQIILKYYSDDEGSSRWAASHPEYLYIPMLVRAEDAAEAAALKKHTSVIGAEILPESPEDRFLDPAYIDMLHRNGLKVWCNSLTYSNNLIFGGGYDDNRSLQWGGQAGWGQLIDRGVDIIQTDWVFELSQFCNFFAFG